MTFSSPGPPPPLLTPNSESEISGPLRLSPERRKLRLILPTLVEGADRAPARPSLSGSACGGTGSVGVSKAFSERREPLFHPPDFALLGNCQAIVMPYDGSRSLDARRVYLKPDFLPADPRTDAPPLNALVSLLPAEGRVISIEDTLESRLRRSNCLRFEPRGSAGERILPHNFASGRDYRGGNALYLALNGLERGYPDPALGRLPSNPGGRRVRPEGRERTPIMYVDFRQRRTARDEQGQPIRDEEGRPKLEWVQRDRPLVKLHHVFNVEQTEGLQLRTLQTAPGPEWEGHERAEAMIKASGVRVDHEADDRAYYSLKADRVVGASSRRRTPTRHSTSWATRRDTRAA